MHELKGKRVFVGLSGGVDSAVSAALLQKAGAEVTGVFIKGWYPPGMPCTWAEDRRDAMRVAAHLGIPFHTLDASAEYKKGVIDYLLSEYAAGRTPNPDIMCNREVKFGAFYTFAREHSADFIATGHYAKVADGKLFRGNDPTKDQSYFLWAVPSDALKQTVFPIGTHPKTEVRELARNLKLPVAQKKDSQGICFLGSISVDEFLREELGTKKGKAVTKEGEVVGTHDGAVLHTLGERVALQDASAGPWYVVTKDMKENILTVSRDQHMQVQISDLKLSETNWLVDTCDESSGARKVQAQYRYHGPLISGEIDFTKNIFTPSIPISEPVALGQSLVIYDGDLCVGGGIIS